MSILKLITAHGGSNHIVENLRSGERGADDLVKHGHARLRVLVGGELVGDHIGKVILMRESVRDVACNEGRKLTSRAREMSLGDRNELRLN